MVKFGVSLLLTVVFAISYYAVQFYYSKEYYSLFLKSERNFSISENIIRDRLQNISEQIAQIEMKLTPFKNNAEIIKGKNGYVFKDKKSLITGMDSSMIYLLSKELYIPIEESKLRVDQLIKNYEEDFSKLETEKEKLVKSLVVDGGRVKDKMLREKLLSMEDFEYFSWVSGTSTGYGDIYPLTTESRIKVRNQVILSLTTLTLTVSSLFNLLLEILNILQIRLTKRNDLEMID